MTPRVTPHMLEGRVTKRYFDGLVGCLSEDVAGVHYDDPGSDDFKELDERIAADLTEFLLGLELPDQISREEAAMHERADRDAEAA